MYAYQKSICPKSWWSSFFFSAALFANPYPDPNAVPRDPPYIYKDISRLPILSFEKLREVGSDVLRVDVDWKNESYTLGRVLLEKSGTPSLVRRSTQPNPFGSYQSVLRDKVTRKIVAYDSLGTGMEFRLLTRAMTFRFPRVSGFLEFELTAENPSTGKMESVLKQDLPMPANIDLDPDLEIEVRQLQSAESPDYLVVNLYSDGYQTDRKDQFFQDAQRAVDVLKSKNFPSYTQMQFQAVFSPSNTLLGNAKNLGIPVPVRDSFLGLYFPYWDNFGRWYNIVYPTSEKKFRDGIGLIPYDYPIVLMDSDDYWGVGNFNELTAIPSHHYSFTYLLLHEFGHYFGLNEEYESGGKTELAFAPGISEPWSPNITFLKKPAQLKWKNMIQSTTLVPTPSSVWVGSGPFGAYRGGYAETAPLNTSHKPGFGCVMENGSKFCPICKYAIESKVTFDIAKP